MEYNIRGKARVRMERKIPGFPWDKREKVSMNFVSYTDLSNIASWARDMHVKESMKLRFIY